MVFENLSVFQNILFLLACGGVIVLICYLISLHQKTKHKSKNLGVDDIDSPLENFEEPAKFVFNAFALKGSIFFIAVCFSVAFMLSVFMVEWGALLIGAGIGLIVVIAMAFVDRDNLSFAGELAVVSEEIPENNQGFGSVILMSDGALIKASTTGKALKKGKKVLVVEHSLGAVVVKKFKRHNK